MGGTTRSTDAVDASGIAGLAPTVVLATAGYDHTIRFWDVIRGVCTNTLQHAESHVNSLAVSPDKRLLLAAGNPHIRMFDTGVGASAAIHVFEAHHSNVASVGFQKDGKWVYSGSEDGTIKIWDLRSAKCQRDIANKAPITAVILHPNQGELISCDVNGCVRVWDLAGNSCIYEMVPDEDVSLRSVTMSNDGEFLVVANNKGRFFVWQTNQSETNSSSGLSSYALCGKVQAHNTYITKCVLSPDASILVTSSADHTAKVWNMLDEYKPLHTLTGHSRWIWDVAFSADSEYVVTASSDTTARLWDVHSGETICSYAGHNKALTSVALNDLSSI